MDDYFLQPYQRTEERLAEPGGNVDYERFKEEIYDKKLEMMYKKSGFKVRNDDKEKHEFIQPIYNMILRIGGKTEENIFSG